MIPDFAKPYKAYINKCIGEIQITSDSIDIDDLRQEAYLAIWRGLKSYNAKHLSGAKLSTFILTCIHNAMLSEATKFYGRFRLPNQLSMRVVPFKKGNNTKLGPWQKKWLDNLLYKYPRNSGLIYDPEPNEEKVSPLLNAILHLKANGYTRKKIKEMLQISMDNKRLRTI